MALENPVVSLLGWTLIAGLAVMVQEAKHRRASFGVGDEGRVVVDEQQRGPVTQKADQECG